MRRPATLAEVAAWSDSLGAFSQYLAEFLDEFYLERRGAMLEEEPARLIGKIHEGEVADAYLAATAVALARLLGRRPPPWAMAVERRLEHPWFASRGPAIRATLLVESPASFRERNLFVSENVLARA